MAAKFRVTGFIENCDWQTPDDLEAARALLAARYDLRIGVWDLVRNPDLRRTLLDSSPSVEVAAAPARLPTRAMQQARTTVARKVAEREERDSALATITRDAPALLNLGWKRTERPYTFQLPLTEPVRRWLTEPYPLASLHLSIDKRKTYVIASTALYNQLDLPQYVQERRAQFEAVAGIALPHLDNHWPELWRDRGGWGDSVDWVRRYGELAECTSAWVSLMSAFVAECRRSHACTYP